MRVHTAPGRAVIASLDVLAHPGQGRDTAGSTPRVCSDDDAPGSGTDLIVLVLGGAYRRTVVQ
ncbi:MAG: hypothetical protein IPM29_02930 [Planctomycetes bacterium]|nr:hypothetical protein [Planctomycetota bacterium]